jgi:MoaA/NifB/PqqE/SkfB family radical SAM enzyme
MLYFQPATGTHVRVEAETTRGLRRSAPRVAMFGITNHCNLRCSFCSRDTTRASEWTGDSAYAVLAGLARAGTLEVAFGGGEPFAFRGFSELLVRLRDTTMLASHVTTNGTLLRDVDWRALRGALGQVRLSIYDDVDWRASGACLSEAGQRWGANVLVDERELAMLPERIGELAQLGAKDVSLLSYVGADRAKHLDAEGEARLARIVAESPLPVRLSVCFGSRVDAPRLFRGADDSGDCGAGRDFVSITPDRRLQSCSFQDASFPIESADDVLRMWNERQEALSCAASRAGCARGVTATATGSAPARRSDSAPSFKVWQAFSGNNSGECIMVARFETDADAEKYLAELVPGFVPGEPYSAPWRELFTTERVDTPAIAHAQAPEELVSAGRSVFARTKSAADDDFPELRAFAWKRGGQVLEGGIHEHDTPTMLFVVRASPADIEPMLHRVAASDPAAAVVRHGDIVIGAIPIGTDLEATVARVGELAGGAKVAREIFFGGVDHAALTHEAKRLSTTIAETPRMIMSFWSTTPEARASLAADFARSVTEARTTVVGSSVLVDGITRKKRLAVLGHRKGAFVGPLLADVVTVNASIWRDPPPRTKGQKAPPAEVIEVDALQSALEPRLRAAITPPRTFELSCVAGPSWRQGVTVRVTTNAPREVFEAIASTCATMPGVSLSVGASDTSVLAFALRRLIEEVD